MLAAKSQLVLKFHRLVKHLILTIEPQSSLLTLLSHLSMQNLALLEIESSSQLLAQ